MPVGDVDRDALLTLGLEAVGQQRVVDLADRDGRSAPPGGAGVLELIDWYGVGLDQQAADQSGLAVVDGAAGDHAQHCGAGLGGTGQGIGLGHECRGHQK